MKWQEISLAQAAKVSFGDGTIGTLSYAGESPYESFGRLVFESGEELTLPGVVDDGETTDELRIFALSGRPLDDIILCGGVFAYRIRSNGTIVEKIELRRFGRDLEELWSLKIVVVPKGLLVLYEDGALRLNQDLAVEWHTFKTPMDAVVRITEEALFLLCDGEIEWRIFLEDGSVPLKERQAVERYAEGQRCQE